MEMFKKRKSKMHTTEDHTRLSDYDQIVKELTEDALPTAAEFPFCSSSIQSIEARKN